MYLESITQYLLVALAVGILVGLKIFILSKRVNKQTEGYIDPDQCIDQVGKQIEKTEMAEKMLENYVGNSKNSP